MIFVVDICYRISRGAARHILLPGIRVHEGLLAKWPEPSTAHLPLTVYCSLLVYCEASVCESPLSVCLGPKPALPRDDVEVPEPALVKGGPQLYRFGTIAGSGYVRFFGGGGFLDTARRARNSARPVHY